MAKRTRGLLYLLICSGLLLGCRPVQIIFSRWPLTGVHRGFRPGDTAIHHIQASAEVPCWGGGGPLAGVNCDVIACFSGVRYTYGLLGTRLSETLLAILSDIYT